MPEMQGVERKWKEQKFYICKINKKKKEKKANQGSSEDQQFDYSRF